jgi:hypothetical protein
MPKTTKSAPQKRSARVTGSRLFARPRLSRAHLLIFLLLFASIGYVLFRFSSAGTVPPVKDKLGLMPSGNHSITRFKQLEAEIGRPIKFVQINTAPPELKSDGTPNNSFLNCVAHTTAGGCGTAYDDIYWAKEIRNRGGSLTAELGFSLIYRTGSPSTVEYSNGVQKQHYLNTANGMWDNQFHYIAKRLRDAGMGNSIIRPGWEMNYACCGAGVTGDGGPEAYAAAWRRMHGIFKQYNDRGETNFKFFWNPLHINTTANSFSNDMRYYPGDAYVDIMGYDLYDSVWGTEPKSGGIVNNTWADPAGVWNKYHLPSLNSLKDYAVTHNKQVGFGEWAIMGGGCTTSCSGDPITLKDAKQAGVDNPTFMQKMYEWNNSLPASGGGSLAVLNYFAADVNHSGPHYYGKKSNGSYVFPNARSKFLQLFGGVASTTPTPAPTPPPSVPPSPLPPPSPTPTPSGQPDLVVTALNWAPATPKVGDEVVFAATIKNQGNTATPDGVRHGVAFSVNGGSYTWSDDSTTSLAAGASRTLTANWGSANKNSWTAGNGTYNIQAYVDDVNRITNESNETNNKLTKTLTTVADPVQTDPTDMTKPSQPGNLHTTVVSQTQIALAWSASTDNKGVVGYNVYRNGVKVASPTGASFADSNLGSGTTYKYQVSAYDAGTNESIWSNEVTATTTTQPSAETTQPPSNSNPIEVTPENASGPVPVPANDAPVVSGTVTLNNSGAEGTEAPMTTLKVDGQPVRVIEGSTAIKIDTSTLANGTHKIELETIDKSGNKVNTSRDLVIDNNLNPLERLRNSILKPFAGKWSARTMNTMMGALAVMPFVLAATAIWAWVPHLFGPKLVRFR